MEDTSRRNGWLGRVAAIVGLLFATLAGGAFLLSRADGPVFVFAGGPLRSGEQVDFADMDWNALDELHELELEIVGAASSRTLWFSVHEGVPYVACDLDCIDGRLTRWPQQIESDDRVVIRIDGKRVEGQLIHVPHGSAEYEAVRAGRERKYSGAEGGRAAAETAAHGTVVEVGEALTGRSKRKEPGDRLYRVDPRRRGARLGCLSSKCIRSPSWASERGGLRTLRRRAPGIAMVKTGVGAWIGTRQQLPHSDGAHRAPIAKDSGLPRVVIRFRMLQASSASASCDFG